MSTYITDVIAPVARAAVDALTFAAYVLECPAETRGGYLEAQEAATAHEYQVLVIDPSI